MENPANYPITRFPNYSILWRSLLQHRALIGSGLGLCRLARFPGGGIGGSVGVYAEIPDVEIHLFFVEHFHQCIFSGWQWFSGSNLYPVTRWLAEGLDPVFLLADFSVHGNAQVADNACAFLVLQANDAVTVGLLIAVFIFVFVFFFCGIRGGG